MGRHVGANAGDGAGRHGGTSTKGAGDGAGLPSRFYRHEHPSPLGPLLLVTDEAGALCTLDFHNYADRAAKLLARQYGPCELVPSPTPPAIAEALDAYFAGDLNAVHRLLVATRGTAFQEEVWRALRTIPPGATMSYGALAARLGRPGASRAVGLANGSNPVAIVTPCHRVIGASGSLTGFGGGLERKRWLLAHEARYAAPSGDLFAPARVELGARDEPVGGAASRPKAAARPKDVARRKAAEKPESVAGG